MRFPMLGRITSLIDIHGHVHLSLNRLLYLLAALGMRGKERRTRHCLLYGKQPFNNDVELGSQFQMGAILKNVLPNSFRSSKTRTC